MTETNENEFEYHAQVTNHPFTILEGEPTGLLPASGLLNHENDNTGVGIILKNPKLVKGSLWKNTTIPDGYESVSPYNDDVRRALADEGDYVRGEELSSSDITNARERITNALDEEPDWENEVYEGLTAGSTDYKAVDPSDRDTDKKTVTIGDETHTTGVSVGSGEFESEEVDGFDSESIVAWYGGMSANIMLRALDVNGGNFARFTDSGEFVTGLMQPPTGWRTDGRDECKDDGRYPKAIRPPVLRPDLRGERIFVSLSRFNNGRGFEANLGRALNTDSEYDEFVGALNGRDSSYDDIEYEYDEIGLSFNDDAISVLVDEFGDVNDVIEWHDAEGYVSTPDGFSGDYVTAAQDDAGGDSGGSFDIGVDDEDNNSSDGGVSGEERKFGEMVATKLAGTGADPDENGTFEGGNDLSSLVEENESNFDGTPDVSNIRKVVYEETDYLDAGSL